MPDAINSQSPGINLFSQVASQSQVEKVATPSEKSAATPGNNRDTVSISAEAQNKLKSETEATNETTPTPPPPETVALRSSGDIGDSPR